MLSHHHLVVCSRQIKGREPANVAGVKQACTHVGAEGLDTEHADGL